MVQQNAKFKDLTTDLAGGKTGATPMSSEFHQNSKRGQALSVSGKHLSPFSPFWDEVYQTILL